MFQKLSAPFCTFQKSRSCVLPKTSESKSINARNIDFIIPYADLRKTCLWFSITRCRGKRPFFGETCTNQAF